MRLMRMPNGAPSTTGSYFDWLQDEINRLFDPEAAELGPGLLDRPAAPRVDIVEYEDRFELLCDLPGVNEDDIELTIAANVLTLKGEKKAPVSEERREKDCKLYRDEIWYGNFQRTISLPQGVDSEKVQATSKNGVLTVTVPKRDEAKQRRIEIKSS